MLESIMSKHVAKPDGKGKELTIFLPKGYSEYWIEVKGIQHRDGEDVIQDVLDWNTKLDCANVPRDDHRAYQVDPTDWDLLKDRSKEIGLYFNRQLHKDSQQYIMIDGTRVFV